MPLVPRKVLSIVLAAGAAGVVAPPAAAAVDGAWGYFGNPRAVYAGGVTYYGFVNSRGDVGVGAVADRTGRQRTKILAPRFGRDDHNSPSLWVRPDGRIVAFWSPHSGHIFPLRGRSRLYYRVSCSPGRIRCFGPTRTIKGNTGRNRLGYTYPSTVYAPRTRTLWLFWRGGDWQPTYVRSRDGGRTWTRPRTLLRGGRKVYAVYASDGAGGFHVAVMGDNPSVGTNSIYYLRYRNGHWHRADGTRVGSLHRRIRFQHGDRVYRRGTFGSDNSWVLDVAQDARGMPIVLYRLPRGRQRGYWYARWTGERWSRHFITRSSRLHGLVQGRAVGGSMGGAVLDHETPEVVYLSRVSGASAEIEVAVTADGGRSWAVEPITSGSLWPNLRPTSPLGYTGGLSVLWMHGPYEYFRRYDTRITTLARGPDPIGTAAPAAAAPGPVAATSSSGP